ncbi:MAG: MBL fold metallo-hydrolase [Paraclostridium sordellii]
MNIEVRVEKAFNGDCIWLRYGKTEKANIIIDSGPGIFESGFKKVINDIKKKKEEVNLLILTHIDNDHILGAKNYITKNDCEVIKKIWLNGEGVNVYSTNQALSPKNVGKLVAMIKEKGIELITPIYEGHEDIINGAELKVITPKKEAVLQVAKLVDRFNLNSSNSTYTDLETLYLSDKYEEENTPTNKASISFIFQYEDKKIAFLGDSVATDVIEGLNKYFSGDKMDLVKIAHHGSKHNTNCDLIRELGANKFIISKQRKVDKETIARIVNCCEKSKIYCNYDWWRSINYFSENDKVKYIDTGRLSIYEQNLIVISDEESL